MKLHLFNPENDLCLANGGEDYMPPPSARLIAHDLAALPFWYGDDTDAVLLPADFDLKENTALLVIPDIGNRIVREGKVPENVLGKIKEIAPWGWSAAAEKRLRRLGIDCSLLPDKQQTERIRELSNRKFAVEVLAALAADGFELKSGIPEILQSAAEVRSFVEQYPDAILKAPWSGSGKGLWRCFGEYNLTVERWSNGVLKSQKLIVGERFLDKQIDFAMQFYSNGAGEVQFAGYSLFCTDNKGAYKGNFLAPDHIIEEKITEYCRIEKLRSLRNWLCGYFSTHVAPYYKGYFGVDMLCFGNNEGGYSLHPCVEVNLRMTMGMVTRIVYDKHVSSEKQGFFRIDYHNEPGVLLSRHNQNAKNPNYLSLTPVTPDTRYQARVGFD